MTDRIPDPAGSPPPAGAPASRARLALECAALFVAVPLVLAAAWKGGPVLPFLWLAALGCGATLLRDRAFDRRAMWDAGALPRFGKTLLIRSAAAAALLFALAWRLDPAGFLFLPRERPVLWVLIVVLYPALSVYPQEVVYRAFFAHRYRPLFGDGAGLLAAGAAAFALVHIVFRSPWAVALTAVAGLALGDTYRRGRSLAVCSLEHSLYGACVFTAGLGPHFYSATEKTVRILFPGAAP